MLLEEFRSVLADGAHLDHAILGALEQLVCVEPSRVEPARTAPHPYPAMLGSTSTNDPRVGFWHAANFVHEAARRGAGTAQGPILLTTDEHSGHYGSSGGRFQKFGSAARNIAFLHMALGLDLV